MGEAALPEIPSQICFVGNVAERQTEAAFNTINLQFVVCDVKNCENNINKVSVAFFDVQESPHAQHSMCNVIKEEVM